ncbi:hypothetical protein V8D89_001892 [Ganoderma adspersum]
MGKKLQLKLRSYPKHMFAQWGERLIPPRNDGDSLATNISVWDINDPQSTTDAVDQPSTEQTTAGTPVAASSDLLTGEDDEAQEGSSAEPNPPSPEQRAEGATSTPPPNFYVNSAPTTPTDRAPHSLSPHSLPATTPYSLPAASPYLPHGPLDASHLPRYHPYRPPRPRHASWPVTQLEETRTSTSYGRNDPRYTSDMPRTRARNAQVRSTSPFYPRLSVDPYTGSYYWSGTMDPAALNEMAAPAEPSHFGTAIPPAHHLPHQAPRPLPFGYPSVLPQDAPFYGQNGVAGLFQPQEDALTADRQALYHPGNARPQWGMLEAQDWHPSLPNGPDAGPSTNEEPFAAELDPLDAPLLPGFSALEDWPVQSQDGRLPPPPSSQERW